MTDLCPNCGEGISIALRSCAVCGADVGFPNVRRAQVEAEKKALLERLERVRVSCQASGTLGELAQFEASVDGSKAVMNRSLGALSNWLESGSQLFVTFHRQVSSGGRLPQENVWDEQRKSAENTVNPVYFEDLNFAALTLTDIGLPYYGPYSVILNEGFISKRTTVFEENPFLFNRRLQIYSGEACPLGYRATWDRRSQLAAAKLGTRLRPGMGSADFSSILLDPNIGGSENADFIEAHIYGPLHVRTISHVSGPVPSNGADRAIWGRVKRALKKVGATWSEL